MARVDIPRGPKSEEFYRLPLSEKRFPACVGVPRRLPGTLKN